MTDNAVCDALPRNRQFLGAPTKTVVLIADSSPCLSTADVSLGPQRTGTRVNHAPSCGTGGSSALTAASSACSVGYSRSAPAGGLDVAAAVPPQGQPQTARHCRRDVRTCAKLAPDRKAV
jgi:hypothetical protein